MKKIIIFVLMALFSVGVVSAVSCDADSNNDINDSEIPCDITTSGTYRLTEDIIVDGVDGVGIDVKVANVVIDCENHSMEGQSASVLIRDLASGNVEIKNCEFFGTMNTAVRVTGSSSTLRDNYFHLSTGTDIKTSTDLTLFNNIMIGGFTPIFSFAGDSGFVIFNNCVNNSGANTFFGSDCTTIDWNTSTQGNFWDDFVSNPYDVGCNNAVPADRSFDQKAADFDDCPLTFTDDEGTNLFTGGGVTGGCTVDGDCDDSNVCTTDSCVSGSCQNTANTAQCDDGNACTTGDICSGGSCGGSTVDCSDPVACTDDGCDPETGCENVANDANCEDGNECTADSCDEVTGCANNSLPNDTPCDGGTCKEGFCEPSTEPPGVPEITGGGLSSTTSVLIGVLAVIAVIGVMVSKKK